MLRQMASIFLALVASGCMGSATTSIDANNTLTEQIQGNSDYNELIEYGNQISQLTDLSAALTDQDIPSSGAAIYRGTVSAGLQGDAVNYEAAGLVEIEVEFATGDVDGVINDIVTSDGAELIGELSVVGGSVSTQTSENYGYHLSGEIDGEIESETGAVFEVDALLLGDFFDDAQSVAGIIIGSAGSGAESLELVDGVWIAAQGSEPD